MNSVGIRLGIEADTSQLTRGMNEVRQSFISAGQSIDETSRSLSSFIDTGKIDEFSEAQAQRKSDKLQPFIETGNIAESGKDTAKEREKAPDADGRRKSFIETEKPVESGKDVVKELEKAPDTDGRRQPFIEHDAQNFQRAILETIRNDTDATVNAIGKTTRAINENNRQNNLPTNPSSGEDSSSSLLGRDDSSIKGMEGLRKAITGGTGLMAANKFIDASFGVANGFIGIADSDRRRRVSVLQGDVYGAQENSINKGLNIEKTATSGVVAASMGIGAAIGTSIVPGVGTALGALIGAAAGGIVKSIGDKIGSSVADEKKSEIQFNRSMSEMYKNVLPMTERGVSSFYDRDDASKRGLSDVGFFREQGSIFRNILASRAKDTGLELNDFAGLALDLSKQGIGYNSPEKAAGMARQAALYARFTDGDVNQFNSFIGLAGRYGKENENSFDIAYGAARASGLQNAQFGEFLQGIESVMESGISKGFARSTEDISATLVDFSRLSGGSSFWTGEQGASRLNQINSGIENATALNDSSQVLAYRAFRDITDGGELDVLAAMERGIETPEQFNKLSEYANRYYGDDPLQNAMFWKNLTGLGFNDSMQLVEMQKNSLEGKGVSRDELDSILKGNGAPERLDYKSDSSNMTNEKNDLAAMAAEFGVDYFRDEVEELSGYTEDIKDELVKRNAAPAALPLPSAGADNIPEWAKTDRAVTEANRAEASQAKTAVKWQERRFKDSGNEILHDLSNPKSGRSRAVSDFVKSASAENGTTEDMEKARVYRYMEQIINSRNDSDASNDRYVSDYGSKYQGVLTAILGEFGKMNGYLERVEKNTREVEVN